MSKNFYKHKWMEKMDSFFMTASKIILTIIVGSIVFYCLYKWVVPYEVGKREFYQKEFYRNHKNY